jgi:hypothetical protein
MPMLGWTTGGEAGGVRSGGSVMTIVAGGCGGAAGGGALGTVVAGGLPDSTGGSSVVAGIGSTAGGSSMDDELAGGQSHKTTTNAATRPYPSRLLNTFPLGRRRRPVDATRRSLHRER